MLNLNIHEKAKMVLSNKTPTKPYSVRARPASRPGAAIAIAIAAAAAATAFAVAVDVDSKSSNFSSSIAGCGGVMGKAKTESSLSCFTSSGDYFAALSADGVVKVCGFCNFSFVVMWLLKCKPTSNFSSCSKNWKSFDV